MALQFLGPGRRALNPEFEGGQNQDQGHSCVVAL